VLTLGVLELRSAEPAPIKVFAIEAGDAAKALNLFTQQSGQDLLYSADAVYGVTTNAVHGSFAPNEALDRLLAGTLLRATKASRTSAIAIVRSGSVPSHSTQSSISPIMKNSSPLMRLLTALFVSGGALGASAQTSPDQSQKSSSATVDQTVKLPDFVVSANPTDEYRATNTTAANRVSGNVMDIAGSITVFTPEFLQDIAPTRLFDATKYAAGISEGQGDGFYDRQYIRGFQNNRPTVDNFASIQAENADSLFIDHIEVVKGPSALLAPTGTPGGQINVINKVPLYTAANSVSVELGRIDAQRVSIDLTGPFAPKSPFAYRLLAGYQDGELNTSGTKDKRKLIGAQLSYQISDRTTLTVRGTYEDRWQFVYFPAYFDPVLSVNGADGQLAPGFALTGSRNGTESWAHRGGRYSTVDMLLTSSVGDHISVRLAAKVQDNAQRDAYMYGVIPYDLSNRYNPYTGQETPNYTWALDPASGKYLSTYSAYYDPTNLIRQPSTTSGDTTDFNVQGDIAAKYNFNGITSTTVVGAVLDHGNDAGSSRAAATLAPFNLLDPVYGAQPNFGAVNYTYSSSNTSDEEYINEQLGFWKDRIIATGAVVRTGSQGSSNGVSGDSVAKAVGQYGLLFKPVEHVTTYVSRSENAVPGYPNGTLLWQDGKQTEFGAKASFFNNRLSLTAAHFNISQTNVSVANPRFQSDPNNQPRNLISDIKEHGDELELMGGITNNISLVGSVTFLHQRDSLDRRVIMVPDRSAALLVNYRFTEGSLRGLSAFVGTTYVSRRSGEIPQIDFTALGVVTQPSFYLPSLQLWSLGAKYTWGRITTALNVDNVFDKKYVALSSGRFLAGVGTPLNVRLTTTFKF
jgi:iron complex outermembrane receptor protein